MVHNNEESINTIYKNYINFIITSKGLQIGNNDGNKQNITQQENTKKVHWSLPIMQSIMMEKTDRDAVLDLDIAYITDLSDERSLSINLSFDDYTEKWKNI